MPLDPAMERCQGLSRLRAYPKPLAARALAAVSGGLRIASK
jgi:hypothetical protein